MNALKFDLYALAEPESTKDLIALASEALAEMRAVNARLSEMLQTQEEPAL